MAKRTLYLESFAGIAGDMFTAAFLDAGLVDPAQVEAVPGALGLPEVRVEIEDVQRASARFTNVRVVDPNPGGHHHHHYSTLVRQIDGSGLDPVAKAFALEVFRLLAEAEADSHGVSVEKVAFHEVGAVDSVVDVAMAGVCVSAVGADKILASPIKLGRGSVQIQHGTYPVPPPASARLAVGMPVDAVPAAITRANVELSTPTGLAILKALKPEFVEGWPPGTLTAQGSGSGTMDLGTYPNVFRVALLEGDPSSGGPAIPFEVDQVVEIRCNLDDETGERMGWLVEKGLAMGALDAWISPVVGKKGRPANLLTLLVRPDQLHTFTDFLLRNSSTFGVRYSTWDRFKLVREFETRETEKGPIRFKVGRTTEGDWLKEKPEFDDLKEVWETDPDFKP